ncbi:MAG: AAA family ATPase [Dehalococcoidia bacterium]
MNCTSCGHENRDAASFCDGCGSALARACPACGAELRATAKFCDSCGAQRANAPQARTPTPAPTPALPSSFAAGRYQVQRFLGEGGKKRVYLARDSRLETDVAIALIKTEGLDAEGLTRVRREAQAMGRLRDDPHIVSVLDIGDENGQPYLVQEFMAGGSLEDLLREAEGHRLDVDHAMRIALEVCGALAHAHGRGIVHRDLKPGNVWLSKDGAAKLGDFGLAVALDRSRLTREGMMVGTATYMPPEQALGGGVTPRSDLYALGCVLYEMVAGRPPFLGDETVAMISQHINTAPVDPTWLNPEVPRSLGVLTLQLLSKAPGERPESAQTVAAELQRIAERSTEETAAPAPAASELLSFYTDVFVGRRAEMDQLKTALESSLSGRGSLVMLVGEPGIGKSRLAEEFGVYAALRGAQVLTGHCYEGEVALPYRPFTEAFRQYAKSRPDDALRDELGPGAPEIAKLISEVRERFPDISESPPLEAEAERVRLFDSVAEFLRNATNATPIVLVLDDIHWADKPSLLLMRHLARGVADQRLLIIGAYRDVELDRTHPLAEVVATLRREQPYQRVLLRGLPQEDVLALLGAIEPSEESAPGRQALAVALYQETEGNPFFVREVLAHLIEEGQIVHRDGRWQANVGSASDLGIPEGVREVIGRRLSRLSEGCNRMLTLASTMTGGFTWEELKAITGEDEGPLLDVLEEALSHQLVHERKGGQEAKYDFTHALIRQTLYGELSTPRRVLLHRQIGQALETVYAANLEPHLGELAHHFYQAAPGGDVDKAVEYAKQAGDHASRIVAWEEAATHYGLALQALELKEPPDDERRCELLLALASAHNQAGDRDKAKTVAAKAAEIARRRNDSQRLARAALEYAFTWGEPGELDEPTIAVIQEGIAAIANDESALRARLLFRLGMELWLGGAPERGLEPAGQAYELARRVGDTEALAEALFLKHGLAYGPEVAGQRVEEGKELVDLAEASGDKVSAIFGRYMRLRGLLELCDVPGADAELIHYEALADELRRPQYQSWTELFQAGSAARRGRFEEAAQLSREGRALAERAQDDVARLIAIDLLALCLMHSGRIEELAQEDRGIIEGVSLPPAIAYASALESFMGNETETRHFFEELMHDGLEGAPREGTWTMTLASLAMACAVLHDADRAAILYDLLLPYAGRNILDASGSLEFGAADRYLGLLAVTMSRLDDAARHFDDALATNERLGSRPWTAHTQFDYASMLVARGAPGDREKALDLLSKALETAQEIGMKKIVERALALRMELQGIAGYDVNTSIAAVAVSVGAERPELRTRAAPDGTVTLLFTDIEGSTALNERMGDQRWMDTLRVHNAIVRDAIAAHGGYEVKSQGDGFMIAFGSARLGLQCAIALQRNLSQHSAAEGERVQVRIGLHTGEAIKEADDFYGHHVNLAARIADQARGGEILVSSLLRELTNSAGEFQFDDGRSVDLKGLSSTQRVFRVAWLSQDSK